MTKYGIVSDIHCDPRIIIPVVQCFKHEGVESMILDGDLVDLQEDPRKTQDSFAFILRNVAESGLKAYAQPGSHEPIGVFKPVMDAFAEKYDNLFEVSTIAKVEHEDHHLIMIPGSDVVKGGEYMFGNELPTGLYAVSSEGATAIESVKEFVEMLKGGAEAGIMQYQNVEDLRQKVTAPEKTIVVCHVPRKFENLEKVVDSVEFGEATEDLRIDSLIIYKDGEIQVGSILQPKPVEKEMRLEKVPIGRRMPVQFAESLAKAGYPVSIVKKNCGNDILKSLYEELKITKAVSGHFHETSHCAHDSKGNPVKGNELVSELFWNSGCLAMGHFGILTVQDGKVSYQNVELMLKR